MLVDEEFRKTATKLLRRDKTKSKTTSSFLTVSRSKRTKKDYQAEAGLYFPKFEALRPKSKGGLICKLSYRSKQ